LKLHEFQSKALFGEYGIPVPRGKVATTPDEAYAIAAEIGGTVVVKAQVHVGGRGKAGGVKLAKSPEEARDAASSILGMNIKGLTVHQVLVDPGANIQQEIYLAITNDRQAGRPLIIASAEGGMDIEELAVKKPSAIVRLHVDPLVGLKVYHANNIVSAMGVPREVLWRHPFPGPGLAIRCLGDLNKHRLAVLRAADAIVEEELRANGLYDSVWQCFPVLLPVRSVGVMGDERTYDECIAIRGVTSVDGMTADWARLPYDVLSKMSSRIINEVRGVNRVVYDVSSKPPATIEWE